MRLAIIASHPVQYYAPMFRALAREVELVVFYGHRASGEDQARAGFGVSFAWDVDLLEGYDHQFLDNRAAKPGLDHFSGIDTPGVGQKLRDGHFDGVLVLGWYRKCFIQALVAAKLAGIPVLVRGDSHLDTPRSWLKTAGKEAVYPIFLRLFDAALVVGERNRAYWRHYHYPEARLFASPHCVDTEWFAGRATAQARAALRGRLGIANATPLALFAGKLLEFKRPVDLVHAAAHARGAGMPVEILVAGAGPLEGEFRATAQALGVPLHMLGFCNQSQMPEAYAAADLLVLPSNGRETWGLVANEALACGCPVLVSDQVGCAPDLATGAVGRSYPVGDIQACGEAMISMLGNPPSPEEIARVSQRFSITAALLGITEALAATASGGKVSPKRFSPPEQSRS